MKYLFLLLFPFSLFAQRSDTLSLKRQQASIDSLRVLAVAAMQRANNVNTFRRNDSTNDQTSFRNRPSKTYYDSVFNARSLYNENTYVKKTDFNSVKNSLQAMTNWSAQAQAEMSATEAKANAGVDTGTFKADQYRQDTTAQALAGKVNMNSAAITGLQGSFATITNSLTGYRTKAQNDGLYYPLTGNPSNFLNAEVDGSITNELQGLFINGNTITLSSGGGSITVPFPSIAQVPNLPDSLAVGYNRYLTNATAIGNVYTKSQSDNRYLQSYSETDPTVPAYAKSLTAFSVIKPSTDALYKPITYTPSSSEINIALGYTPATQARTLTINGTAFDLSANRSWTVGDVTTASLTTTLAGYATTGALSSGLSPKMNYSDTGAMLVPYLRSAVASTLYATISSVNGKLNITDTAGKWLWLPTINNAPARTVVTTVGAAGFQISSTRPARVSYTVSVAALVTIGQAIAYLEISSNNSTWATITQSGQTSVALLNTSYYNLQCDVPPGWYVRLRSAVTGGGAVTFVVGQETVN